MPSKLSLSLDLASCTHQDHIFFSFCVDLKACSGTVGFSQVGGFHYSESLCFRGRPNQDVVLAQLLAQVLLQILIHSLVL